MVGTDRPAVIVQRVEPTVEPNTTEIISLARSAGYMIEAVITQSREEDSEYNIGAGKVAEVHHTLRDTGSEVVIFDNDLGPYQKYNLGVYFAENVTVLDRYTLILEIFEQRATTRQGQLQVGLARLRYELPRVETKVRLSQREERPGFMGLGEYDENQEEDIKRRISRIQEELSSVETDNEKRRNKRHEEGFDLVAIAGYTNAGKSTLLRRLAEGHSVEENEELHEDLDATAESTPNLFTTLDTTTRRMDYEKRDVLLTDTVGFISDLPYWLIDSFNTTFDSVYQADLVLLVVDMTEPVEKIREKIVSCHDILDNRLEGRLLTVFNKVDALEESEVDRKLSAMNRLTHNFVCISAESGQGIEDLKTKLHRSLPPLERERLYVPMSDETMSFVSWVHDNSYVQKQEFDDTGVLLDFEARPSIVEKARNRAEELSVEARPDSL